MTIAALTKNGVFSYQILRNKSSKQTVIMTNEALTKEQYQQRIALALALNRSHLAQLDHPGSIVTLKYEPHYPLPPQISQTPQTSQISQIPHTSQASLTDKVFFFDIDNCLYKRSTKIHEMMQVFIHEYFIRSFGLSQPDANELREEYYRNYGLAIQGLVKHHKIDALEYNEKVDDALPLQNVLKPDPDLRNLLIALRSSGKIDRLWLFTNAYKNHVKRVISLLGVGDLFDGLTYCDYAKNDFVCKPNVKMFEKAMRQAGVSNYENCYFVDDSANNIQTAIGLGFKKSIHFVERDEDLDTVPKNAVLIRNILELPKVVPELF